MKRYLFFTLFLCFLFLINWISKAKSTTNITKELPVKSVNTDKQLPTFSDTELN